MLSRAVPVAAAAAADVDEFSESLPLLQALSIECLRFRFSFI